MRTMNHYEILLLLRLLSAHIIAGFLLRKKPLANDKSFQDWHCKSFFLHSLAAAFLVYTFSRRWGSWWLLILVFVSHVIIDGIRARLGDGIFVFMAGQITHFTVIIIGWLCLTHTNYLTVFSLIRAILLNREIWVLSLASLLVLWPTGVLIGKITEPWRREFDKDLTDGLKKAGLWIGFLERLLIVAFILLQSYEMIGFLIAAKSILRYGELSSGKDGGEKNSIVQKKNRVYIDRDDAEFHGGALDRIFGQMGFNSQMNKMRAIEFRGSN